MIFLTIGLIVVVVLFLVVYFSKRRFGLLGLALLAGYTLSSLWSYESGILAGVLGFNSSLIGRSVVSLILILIPVVVVLINGYSYNLKILRLIGSFLFIITFMALSVQVIDPIIPSSVSTNGFFKIFEDNNYLIVSFGLILALTDLLMSKPKVTRKGR